MAAKEFRIEPEDVLVVKVKEYLPTVAVVRMKKQIAEVLPGRKVLVFDGGKDFTTLRELESFAEMDRACEKS